MNEQERRIEAIRRVKQGESVNKVCQALGRSRQWYYKWAAVFRKEGAAGLVDRRGRGAAANKTAPWLRQLIVEIRDRLVQQAEDGESFIGISAKEVVRQLAQLGIEPPHWTTVHRILAAEGRIPADRADGPLGYCPRPAANAVNDVHQVDIWPRVLVGGDYLYLFHLVDVASWYPSGLVCADKRTDTALAFLLAAWQEVGLPYIVQFDNEWAFSGGRWAHRLGRVVRLCLALGVQVWFIPPYTPERNGYVESFHHQCNQFLWSRHTFTTIEEVQAKYPAFLEAFRRTHCLPAIGDRTPAQVRAQASTTFQPLNLTGAPSQLTSLPIVAGTIYCARLVDRYAHVKILNHHLTLDAAYARHYVLARIETASQEMTLFHQADAEAKLEPIDSCSFPLPEAPVPFDPTFNYLLPDS